MNGDQVEEIECLKAIFCKDGEFNLSRDAEGFHVTICFDLPSQTSECQQQSTDRSTSSVTFSLGPSYPHTKCTKICLQSSFIPEPVVVRIRQQLLDRASCLVGQPMVLDLWNLLQEILQQEVKADDLDLEHQLNIDAEFSEKKVACSLTDISCRELEIVCENELQSSSKIQFQNCDSGCKNISDKQNSGLSKGVSEARERKNIDETVTALLRLDHMRSKNNYVKLIKRWTQELGLTGRLIFFRRLILILLQGTSQAVREYTVRNRTSTVDVDSKGKPCKERMLDVLAEIPSLGRHQRFSEFQVLELSSIASLQELFHTSAMGNLYSDFVQPFFQQH